MAENEIKSERMGGDIYFHLRPRAMGRVSRRLFHIEWLFSEKNSHLFNYGINKTTVTELNYRNITHSEMNNLVFIPVVSEYSMIPDLR